MKRETGSQIHREGKQHHDETKERDILFVEGVLGLRCRRFIFNHYHWGRAFERLSKEVAANRRKHDHAQESSRTSEPRNPPQKPFGPPSLDYFFDKRSEEHTSELQSR